MTVTTPQTFTIRYRLPYTGEWCEQTFPTRDQAERMVAFYISCGSPAQLVIR